MRSSLRFNISMIFPLLLLLLCIVGLAFPGSGGLSVHAQDRLLRPFSPSHTSSFTPACGSWSILPSSNSGYLNSIAALSTNDVWAVGFSNGQTLIEQWNGSTWSVIPSPNGGQGGNDLNGVAALSANDIWAVGYQFVNGNSQTLTEHWDGSNWSIVPSPNVGSSYNTLQAVTSVPGSSNLWAVGNYISSAGIQPLTEQWNGTNWKVIASPISGTQGAFNDVTASSASSAWVVGYQFVNGMGQTLTEQWNGARWHIIASPTPLPSSFGGDFTAVTQVPGRNQLWAVGSYYDNTHGNQTLVALHRSKSWTIIPSPNLGSGVANGGDGDILNGVSAISANDIWGVGYYRDSSQGAGYQQTLTEQWNGSKWKVVASPNIVGSNTIFASVASVPGTNQVWAVGYSASMNGPAHPLIEFYCS